MADLDEVLSALPVKIMGSGSTGVEQTPVQSTTLGELQVADIPNQTGLSTTLALTTTAIEGKVGASTMVNRKYIEMQGLSNNIKWGYTTTCDFDLFKSQFFSLPAGTNCKVYFKMSTGTGSVAISEK
jgi:hypothetical protein